LAPKGGRFAAAAAPPLTEFFRRPNRVRKDGS
jgi:hypothetical protein